MNNTDSTSFQSILNRAKRLRGENDADKNNHIESTPLDKVNLSSGNGNNNSNVIADNKGRRIPNNVQVINAFNPVKFNGTTNDQAYANKNGSIADKLQNKSNLSKNVMVNTTQKENPLLKHLVNTSWRYISSQPTKKIYYDYFIRDRCVLFLTLTYHKLYVDYIERRMKPLQTNYNNILLFVIDDDSKSEDTINDLTKLCIFNGFTMLVAFNFEQAAKYIEYLNNG